MPAFGIAASGTPVVKNSDKPKPADTPVKSPMDTDTAAKPKPSDDPPSASGIKPPALAKDKVVKAVPSTITDLAVGGGGRYIILYMAKDHKLGIFDLNEDRIVRYITLTADNIKSAAGQTKIVVVLTDTNVIQRWDIATGERDLSIPLATKGKIKLLSMGSASDGPILVGFEDGFNSSVIFADLKTLRPLPYAMTGARGVSSKDCFVRSSADGKVFGMWNPNSSPSGITTLVIAGKGVKASYEHDSAGHVTPDADGKVICTARGLWTPESKRLSKTKDDTYYVPAVQGGYYMSVRLADPFNRRNGAKSALTLFLAGSEQPLATLPQIELPSGINSWDREAFGFDQHILFIPDAKLFVATLLPSLPPVA